MSEAELSTLDTCHTQSSTLDSFEETESDRSTLVSRVFVSPDQSDASSSVSVETDSCSFKQMPSPLTTPASPPVPHDALVFACQSGDVAEARFLIENGHSLDTGALHAAAAHNKYELCKLLLQNGADPNARAPPLDATPVLCAARNGHAYIVKLLIDHNADFLTTDGFGCTLVHLAVQSSNILMVIYALCLNVPVDAMDTGHRTALHWAAAQGDHLSVASLLKAGASPSVTDGDGNCPLALAVDLGHSPDSVGLLLRAGADPKPFLASHQQLANNMSNNMSSELPKDWILGCKSVGRSIEGVPKQSRYLSPETAKLVASLTPFVSIFTAFSLPDWTGAYTGIPLALLLLYLTKKWLDNTILPLAWPEEKPFVHSTVLAGGFCTVLVLDAVFWASNLATPLYYTHKPSVITLTIAIIFVVVFYSMAVLMDPGTLPLKSKLESLEDINELMERGLYDSTHFCVYTNTKIPARASYDHYLERIVCRYDHYCPWAYNAVGQRNHRHFVLFLVSLITATVFFFSAYAELPNIAFKKWYSTFLFAVTLFQSLWIYILALVQLFQLTHGATTHEFSHAHLRSVHVTDPIRVFSSLPKDHPQAKHVLQPTAVQSLRQHALQPLVSKTRCKLLFKLTGIHQVRVLWRLHASHKNWNTYDKGVVRNVFNFFTTGGNLLNPDRPVE